MALTLFTISLIALFIFFTPEKAQGRPITPAPIQIYVHRRSTLILPINVYSNRCGQYRRAHKFHAVFSTPNVNGFGVLSKNILEG